MVVHSHLFDRAGSFLFAAFTGFIRLAYDTRYGVSAVYEGLQMNGCKIWGSSKQDVHLLVLHLLDFQEFFSNQLSFSR